MILEFYSLGLEIPETFNNQGHTHLACSHVPANAVSVSLPQPLPLQGEYQPTEGKASKIEGSSSLLDKLRTIVQSGKKEADKTNTLQQRILYKRKLHHILEEYGGHEINPGPLKRIEQCAELWKAPRCMDCGAVHHRGAVPKNYFCSERLCPVCAHRRAKVFLNKIKPKIVEILKENPGFQILHVVLTVNNSWSLKDRMDTLHEAFKELRRRDIWKGSVEAFYKSVEISFNWILGYHPHDHGLVFLPKDQYIPQNELSQIWLELTGDSDVVQVELARDKQTGEPITSDNVGKALDYIIKYVLKPQSLYSLLDVAMGESSYEAKLRNQLSQDIKNAKKLREKGKGERALRAYRFHSDFQEFYKRSRIDPEDIPVDEFIKFLDQHQNEFIQYLKWAGYQGFGTKSPEEWAGKRVVEIFSTVKGRRLSDTGGKLRGLKVSEAELQQEKEEEFDKEGAKSWADGICPKCGSTNVCYSIVPVDYLIDAKNGLASRWIGYGSKSEKALDTS